MTQTYIPSPYELTGRRVLMMLLGFFAIVAAVNAYFIVAALETYTGVVAVEPYRKGIAYNRRIAADEQQSRLGWQSTLAIAGNTLRMQVSGATGAPMSGLAIAGKLARPATDAGETVAAFVETAPGVYEFDIGNLARGSWIASIDATGHDRGDIVYRMRRRLWFAP